MEPKSNYFSRNEDFFAKLKWTTLRYLGESRIVRSSAYWIFIVPIIARILEHIQSPLTISIFGSSILINLELPFSWYLLYFSALFFSIGVLLYNLYCPSLIADFANFQEFIDQGGEGFRLGQEMEKEVPKNIVHDSVIWQAYIETRKRVGYNITEPTDDHPDWVVQKGLRRLLPQDLFSIFYAVRSVADHSHPYIIKLTGASFFLGIMLLFLVLFQNLKFVIIQLLHNN